MLSLLNILQCSIKYILSSPNGTTCNIYSSSIESLHSIFKSISFFTQEVSFTDSYIVEAYCCGWLTFPTHFLLIFSKRKTFATFFNQKSRYFFLPSQTHHQIQVTHSPSTDEAFRAIYNIVTITLFFSGSLHVNCITSRIRLC